jgi:DNA invertase Pin-like site-specific DNA recombinase
LIIRIPTEALGKGVGSGSRCKTWSEIHAAGVDLYLHQQGIDTTTPAGKAMFQMMGVFAEFERSMIQARVMAGLARARKHATKSGNPFGRPKIDADTEAAIRTALTKGDKGVMKIATEHGVGTGTVQRIKAEMAAYKGHLRKGALRRPTLSGRERP